MQPDEHKNNHIAKDGGEVPVSLLDLHILPMLGDLHMGESGGERVASLQYSLHDRPATANMAVTLLSYLYTVADNWGITVETGNPCRFVRKYPEKGRERFLTEEEFHDLGNALAELEAEGKLPRNVAAAFRLLMLTGCRRNEVLTLRWEDVDLEAGYPYCFPEPVLAPYPGTGESSGRAHSRPAAQFRVPGAGAGGEPADDREPSRPPEGPVRPSGAGLGEGGRGAGGGESSGGPGGRLIRAPSVIAALDS